MHGHACRSFLAACAFKLTQHCPENAHPGPTRLRATNHKSRYRFRGCQPDQRWGCVTRGLHAPVRITNKGQPRLRFKANGGRCRNGIEKLGGIRRWPGWHPKRNLHAFEEHRAENISGDGAFTYRRHGGNLMILIMPFYAASQRR